MLTLLTLLARGAVIYRADYLEEIGKLSFAFDDSKDVFNFAEAALLIQGD